MESCGAVTALVPAEDVATSRAARAAASLGRHAPALSAAAAGAAWFVLHAGVAVLDPTRVGWLMSGDWAANYIGWTFFRGVGWALPLGANPAYPYPVGSTLGFSDSIPLVGVLLKPLAAGLPADFQYVGPWLLLCFALQGFVGAKLVRIVSRVPVAQALGGALFALAPPLLHRFLGPNTGHASLCAHWLVLAFLWIALAPADRRSAPRRLAAAYALLFVASGIHPYFVVMGLALTAALAARLAAVDRLLSPARLALAVAGSAAAAGGGLFLFGYVGSRVATAVWGFGIFSADALALANPMGWSRAWDGFRVGRGQYEGFGYLGGGALLLAAAAVVAAVVARRRVTATPWRRAVPAALAAVALGVVALSNVVTMGGTEVLHLGGEITSGLAAIFRSSGRFVWALDYVTLFAAIGAVAAALRDRPRLFVGALAAALALQVADIRPPVPADFGDARFTPPESDAWLLARGTYRHVALVPPFLFTGGGPVAAEPDACGRNPWPFDAYVPFADIAYRLGATFNSGYLARLDAERAAAACRDLGARLRTGTLEPETVYVVHTGAIHAFVDAAAHCGVIDRVAVCVAAGHSDAFSAAALRTPLE